MTIIIFAVVTGSISTIVEHRSEWTLNLGALLTNWLAFLHMPLDKIVELFRSETLETCELCIHCFLIIWVRCPRAFDVDSTLPVFSDAIHSAFRVLTKQISIRLCPSSKFDFFPFVLR